MPETLETERLFPVGVTRSSSSCFGSTRIESPRTLFSFRAAPVRYFIMTAGKETESSLER